MTLIDERAETAARAERPGSRFATPLVRYLAIRLLISFLLLIGVTIVTFVLTNLVPASPVTAALGERASSDPKIVAAFKAAQGLDKPLVQQYLIYLGHLLHGDLGTSIQTHNPVVQDLAVAFPATVELALFVIVLSVIIGLGLGLLSALTPEPVLRPGDPGGVPARHLGADVLARGRGLLPVLLRAALGAGVRAARSRDDPAADRHRACTPSTRCSPASSRCSSTRSRTSRCPGWC